MTEIREQMTEESNIYVRRIQRFKVKEKMRLLRIPNSQFFIAFVIFLLAASLSARKYNPFVWTTYKEFPYIFSITINMEAVYLGTYGGILRFNRIENKWDAPVTKSDGFPGEKAEIVAFDRVFNKLWIVSDKSLAVYNPQISFWERDILRISLPLRAISSIGFTHERIFLEGNGSIYSSQRGSFTWEKWTGTLPMNIDWFGEKRKVSIRDYPFLTPYYASDEYFNKYEYTTAAVDNKDMWLGTDKYGVFYYNIYTWDGIHYIVGLANNRVDAIYRDKDSYWLGGRNGTDKGITHINFETGEGKYFRSEDIFGLNSNTVYAITGDKKRIWFGTSDGLMCYKKGEGVWKTYSMFDGLPSNIVISLITKEDTIFIGTKEGMALFLPGTEKIVNIETFNNISVNAFGIYRDNLLIGTERGVFLKKDNRFENISDPDGDFNFGVAAIFVDDDALWFGTRRKGVDVYYPDDLEWKEYLYPTPISGEWVFSISGDEDYVWVGTNNGISRYNKKLKMWKTFNETDGLIDNEVRTLYVEKNYIWLGTKEGVTRFKYRDPSVPP